MFETTLEILSKNSLEDTCISSLVVFLETLFNCLRISSRIITLWSIISLLLFYILSSIIKLGLRLSCLYILLLFYWLISPTIWTVLIKSALVSSRLFWEFICFNLRYSSNILAPSRSSIQSLISILSSVTWT